MLQRVAVVEAESVSIRYPISFPVRRADKQAPGAAETYECNHFSSKYPVALAFRLELTLVWPAAGEAGRDDDIPSERNGVVGNLIEISFGGATGEPSGPAASFS